MSRDEKLLCEMANFHRETSQDKMEMLLRDVVGRCCGGCKGGITILKNEML